MKIFQKFAAVSALSMPLLLPSVATADVITPTYLPAGAPVACERASNFGTLDHCLAITGQMSNGVQMVLNQEALSERSILDETLASMDKAPRDAIQNNLNNLDRWAEQACGEARTHATTFNALWKDAISNAGGDHEPGDNLFIIPVTNELRGTLRDFMNANAECFNSVTDTLGYMMEKNGRHPGHISQITSPLYNSIERYRTFDAYRR